MTSIATSRYSRDHRVAATEHERVARQLLGAGEEWSAVCFFYAAFHLVRSALLDDPVFQQAPAAVNAVHPLLQVGDRYAEQHSGGMAGQRSLGINELVTILYPSIQAEYNRLHLASLHVRYGQGLGAISQQAVLDDFDVVSNAAQAGALVHGK